MRDPQIGAMAALQDFNDRVNMGFSRLRSRIETMPIWRGKPRRVGPASRNDNVSAMQRHLELVYATLG